MSRVTTPAKPAAPMPSTQTPPVPHEKIAMRAYDKWCQRGRPHGTTMQDWLDAERELKAECMKSGKK